MLIHTCLWEACMCMAITHPPYPHEGTRLMGDLGTTHRWYGKIGYDIRLGVTSFGSRSIIKWSQRFIFILPRIVLSTLPQTVLLNLRLEAEYSVNNMVWFKNPACQNPYNLPYPVNACYLNLKKYHYLQRCLLKRWHTLQRIICSKIKACNLRAKDAMLCSTFKEIYRSSYYSFSSNSAMPFRYSCRREICQRRSCD